MLDSWTLSPQGPKPTERGHEVLDGTQNPKFRQLSKNHKRFKLVGTWEVPWSVSQLSPQVTDEETVVQEGDGTYVSGHTAHA